MKIKLTILIFLLSSGWTFGDTPTTRPCDNLTRSKVMVNEVSLSVEMSPYLIPCIEAPVIIQVDNRASHKAFQVRPDFSVKLFDEQNRQIPMTPAGIEELKRFASGTSLLPGTLSRIHFDLYTWFDVYDPKLPFIQRYRLEVGEADDLFVATPFAAETHELLVPTD